MRARGQDQQLEWIAYIPNGTIPISSTYELPGAVVRAWVPRGALVDLEIMLSSFTGNGVANTYQFTADGEHGIGGGYHAGVSNNAPFKAKANFRNNRPGRAVRFAFKYANSSGAVTIPYSSYNGTCFIRARITMP